MITKHAAKLLLDQMLEDERATADRFEDAFEDARATADRFEDALEPRPYYLLRQSANMAQNRIEALKWGRKQVADAVFPENAQAYIEHGGIAEAFHYVTEKYFKGILFFPDRVQLYQWNCGDEKTPVSTRIYRELGLYLALHEKGIEPTYSTETGETP